MAANPGAKLISLGIGDTTHPLPPAIVDAMSAYAKGLGTLEGFSALSLPSPPLLPTPIFYFCPTEHALYAGPHALLCIRYEGYDPKSENVLKEKIAKVFTIYQ